MLLATAGIALPLLQPPPQAAAAASQAPLACAALDDALVARNPGVGWALRKRDRQLFYPAWMEGEWRVRARFVKAGAPLGARLVGRTVPGVLKASIAVLLPDAGAGMDRELVFTQRYSSDSEQGGVVADRVFNTQQVMDAFLGYQATSLVTYDPADNPTRLAVVWSTPRKDASVQSTDLRKAEVFINNRGSSGVENGRTAPFCCFEAYRQVTQARQQGYIGDYASWWEVTPSQEGAAAAGAAGAGSGGGGSYPQRLAVRQRVAAYLQPQDALYFEAGDKPVAVYDYAYDYERVDP